MMIFFLIFLFPYVINGEEEVCKIEKLPKIQMVLLVDLTLDNSETTWGYAQKHVYSLFSKQILGKSPNSEIAVVGYKHWSGEVPDLNTDDCYQLLLPFSNDITKIQENVKSYPALKGKRGIVGATAPIAMTMLNAMNDKELKWNKGFNDDQGNIVIKGFVYLTFKNLTTTLKTPGSRAVAKGSPTETCANTLPPSMDVLGNMLTKNGISIYAGTYEAPEYTNNEFGVFKDHMDAFNNPAFRVPIYFTYDYQEDKVIDEKYFTDDEAQYVTISDEFLAFLNKEMSASACSTSDTPVPYNTLGV